MEAVGLFFALPLMILNLLGGLVGGVGLIFEGQWRLVVGGIGYSIVGPFLLSILMIPAMIFVPFAAWAERRNNLALAVVAGIPSMLWTYIIVAVTCTFVFSRMVAVEQGFFNVLWAYSTATAPWSFLAQKDRQNGNDASSTLMFFVQLGTISMMVATLVDPSDTSPGRLLVWFLPFLGLGILAQVVFAWAEIQRSRTFGY